MTQNNSAAPDIKQLKSVIEAALMASEVPLSVRKIRNMFEESERPETNLVNKALKAIEKDCASRGIELRQIGKGYRFQTKDQYAGWLRKLRDTRPPRYSRALVETLSIIAYRQPVTRGDIEGIRGVAVSSDIMRTLLDREWISQVGHRDVPGRPALYATTDSFLEYFNLRSLSELPALMEPRDVTDVAKDLNITLPMAKPDLSAGSDVFDDESDDDEDDEDADETEDFSSELSASDLNVISDQPASDHIDDQQDDQDDEDDDDEEDDEDNGDEDSGATGACDDATVVALAAIGESSDSIGGEGEVEGEAADLDTLRPSTDSNVVSLDGVGAKRQSVSAQPRPPHESTATESNEYERPDDASTDPVAPLNVDFSEFDSLPPLSGGNELDDIESSAGAVGEDSDESSGDAIQVIHTRQSQPDDPSDDEDGS